MQTFDFPFHTVETQRPERPRIQFGGGYVFTPKPDAPMRRKFELKFRGMAYFVNSGGVVDATIEPQRNMLALEQFYDAHELHEAFIYPHPVYGNLTVKFEKPLKTPEGFPGGTGVVKDFSVYLEEQV